MTEREIFLSRARCLLVQHAEMAGSSCLGAWNAEAQTLMLFEMVRTLPQTMAVPVRPTTGEGPVESAVTETTLTFGSSAEAL